MAEVGVRALKQNASAVVAAAVAGEVVTITVRGRPVAQLVPPADSRIEALIAADQARPALRSLADLPVPGRGRTSRALSVDLESARESARF